MNGEEAMKEQTMEDVFQMAAEFRTAILKAKANREFSGDGLIDFIQGEIVGQSVCVGKMDAFHSQF